MKNPIVAGMAVVGLTALGLASIYAAVRDPSLTIAPMVLVPIINGICWWLKSPQGAAE